MSLTVGNIVKRSTNTYLSFKNVQHFIRRHFSEIQNMTQILVWSWGKDGLRVVFHTVSQLWKVFLRSEIKSTLGVLIWKQSHLRVSQIPSLQLTLLITTFKVDDTIIPQYFVLLQQRMLSSKKVQITFTVWS